jgi:hypothetical protein
VLALLFIFVLPALAITYGVPDGNAHPFGGSIVIRIPYEGVFQWCSGRLIDENVFLTASHCTAPLDDVLAANPGAEALVTSDPTITEGCVLGLYRWIRWSIRPISKVS